jgi:hypothetical protein
VIVEVVAPSMRSAPARAIVTGFDPAMRTTHTWIPAVAAAGRVIVTAPPVVSTGTICHANAGYADVFVATVVNLVSAPIPAGVTIAPDDPIVPPLFHEHGDQGHR